MHGRRAKAKAVATTESKGWFWFGVAVIVGYLIALYLPLFIRHAHGHDNHREWSQEAQNNPAIQKWWRDQRVPGGPNQGGSCCNEADGAFAETDIRDGKWFVRFMVPDGTPAGHQVEWMPVPDEVVITKPNLYGQAVVWYAIHYVNGKVHEVRIRCFIPGALT